MADQTDDLVISISTDMTAVKRALTKLGADVGAASADISRKFDKVGSSLDNSITTALQTRVNAMVGIGVKATNEWSGALADQGKQLDALRAKYNPLFATIKQYQAAAGNIKTLYRSGAIGVDEYTNALSKERQATLASISALKGRNTELAKASVATAQATKPGAQHFQTANIAAQFQDIAVTSAMGMNPLQIALQQGTQLSMALGEGGAASSVKALAAGFMTLVSPVSLVTIGLVAGTAALIEYFISSRDKTKELDALLKAHGETIASIKDRYGEASKGVQEYAAKSEAQILADAQDQLKTAQKIQAETAQSAVRGALNRPLSDFSGPIDTITAFRIAIDGLNAGVKSGNPDFAKFQDLMAQIATSDGASESQKKLAKELSTLDEKTQQVISSIPGLVDGLKAIGGAAGDQINRVASLSTELKKLASFASDPGTFGDQTSAAVNSGMSKLNEFRGNGVVNEEGRRRLLIAKSLADQRNDAGFVDTGNGYRIPAPTPEARPNIELEGLPGEIKDQESAAKKAAAAAAELKKKQDDLLRSTADRIEQQQQEITLSGKYGVAADNARMALETWQKAEKLSLNDEQKKALQDKIDAYAKLSETLAKIKLSTDMADENRVASLSTRDQAIVERQKQYGLPTDPNSAEGRQIGQSYDKKELAGGISSFATDIENGLLTKGKKIGEVFGDAVLNSLQSAMKKSLESIINQFANGLASLLTGGKAGGAASGATGVGGVAASVVGSAFGTAPVIPVARMALPNVGSTKTGIPLSSIATSTGMSASVNAAYAPQFQGFLKDLESTGYKIKSLGGYNYRDIAGTSKLSQHAYGDAIDINPTQNPMGKSLITDLPPNVGELAAKNGLAWGGAWNSKKDAMHFEVPDSATKALDKLGSSAGNATKGLGAFGTSASQVGAQLSSGLAGGKGGGASSWLSMLSGSIFSGSKQLAASGGIGLFADGGHVTGPGSPTSDSIPTMLSNGEYVINAASTKKHRALIEAINTGKVRHFADGGFVSPQMVSAPTGPSLMPRASAANNNSQPGILQVQIHGASGDDHVRALVKQGVGDGLTQYGQQQRRGGFGDTQTRWTNQKG